MVASIPGRRVSVISLSAELPAAAASAGDPSPLRSTLFPWLSSMRSDTPSNVTNAFSALQESPAELNFEMMEVALRGMEKIVCASSTSLGIACPIVTLLILVPSSCFKCCRCAALCRGNCAGFSNETIGADARTHTLGDDACPAISTW